MSEDATFSTRVRRMLGVSLHGWENLMVGSLAFAALVAAVVGVSTWAVVKLQRAEIVASQQEFAAYKLETGKKISEANSVAEIAKQKAESERLERIKLEAQFAWRRITDEQQASIIAELSKHSDQSVFVVWISGDPEATLLSWQLISIFQKAYWRAGGEGRVYPNSILSNVVLDGHNAGLLEPLLAKAGLKPSIGPFPPFAGITVPNDTGVTERNASVSVLVGSRLRPADEEVLAAVKGKFSK
jgi:hypothetical protein